MTKINEMKLVEPRAITKAGLSYCKLAQQLQLERRAVAKRCQTHALIADIGPKVNYTKNILLVRLNAKLSCFSDIIHW
jgi:hypothetical protein